MSAKMIVKIGTAVGTQDGQDSSPTYKSIEFLGKDFFQTGHGPRNIGKKLNKFEKFYAPSDMSKIKNFTFLGKI